MPLPDRLEVPPDLARWCWATQQMTSGPRKHPGGWHQFIFFRTRGLAAGDNTLEDDDPALRVKVRRPTWEEALTEALRDMHRISAALIPSDNYAERFAERSRRYSPVIWTT